MDANDVLHQGRVPEWTMGDRLRKAREAAGLTQAELAAAAGISRRAITNYEQDDYVPRRPVLVVISLATGVPMDWLVYGDAGPAQGVA